MDGERSACRASGFRRASARTIGAIVPRHGLQHNAGGLVALAPAHDLDALALEVLVGAKEVLYLLQRVLGDVRDVEVLALEGVVQRDADDLVVRLSAVEHLEHADGTDVDLAAGKRFFLDEYEHVERITVLVQRARDEAVVAG